MCGWYKILNSGFKMHDFVNFCRPQDIQLTQVSQNIWVQYFMLDATFWNILRWIAWVLWNTISGSGKHDKSWHGFKIHFDPNTCNATFVDHFNFAYCLLHTTFSTPLFHSQMHLIFKLPYLTHFTDVTNGPPFPPSGLPRLKMAFDTLLQARNELLLGFGKSNEGGEVGQEIRNNIASLEKEIGVSSQYNFCVISSRL